LYLLMVGIVYYCIIAAVNYKTIRVLIWEVRWMRK
jgi:hypothetical protein